MLFNSFRFLFLFLPAVLFVALRLRGKALMRWLTLSSFFFYAFAGHAWFLIPMLITTTLDFWVAPRIAGAGTKGARKAWLILSLTANLGLLFYFKYARLFVGGAFASVILPAGISFYTFQTMSYVIDVYRGEARPEAEFWTFAAFVSFFPHLIAGPLTRHHQLIPALDRIAKTGPTPRWRHGVLLFSIGLCKKVLIADRIADLINPMIDGGSMGATAAWLGLIGYSLQIYFDFSGYSDMAIGLGRAFGIELPRNFDSPYQAESPRDFWRRWHMTLSSWLRDYVYIPLGGNRHGNGRRFANLMITMTLGGLWHGASWTFAAWGVYHGVLLALHGAAEGTWGVLPAAVRRTATFLLVTLGWVFFRASNFGRAGEWFGALAGRNGLGATGGAVLPGLLLAGLAIAFFAPNASSREDRGLPVAWQAALGAATAAALLLVNSSSHFLYFQF